MGSHQLRAYLSSATLITFVVLLTFISSHVNALSKDEDVKSKIDSFMNNILKCRNIPGINLAIVKDGNILFTDGYGLRRFNGSDAVDNTTHFGVASLSKAFAATLLGKLLSDKGYWYDDVVTSRIRGQFNFSDIFRTKHASFRDILTHKMGMPSYNYARFQSDFTREALAKKLYLFNASVEFRSKFMYNNLMYGLVSGMSEYLGGDTWENLMTDHIFKPLDMDRTTFTHTVNFSKVKYATPHMIDSDTGKIRMVSMEFHSEWGKLGGSGSIFSTADDMAQWLLFQLNNGKNHQGQQVVDERYFKETHKANVYTGKPSYSDWYTRPHIPVTYTRYDYGQGWRIGYYRGYEMVLHTGTSWGYGALLTLIPSLNIGIYTGINNQDSRFTTRQVMHMYIMDLLMGFEPWLNETTACTFPKPWITSQPKSPSAATEEFDSARPLVDYTGTYGNFAFGNMTVVSENGQLKIHYGKIGRWKLRPLKEKDEFVGDGCDIMWPLSLPRIIFAEDKTNRKINSLAIPKFNKESPVRFFRGLKMSDAPAPPTECQEKKTTSKANYLMTGYLWIIIALYSVYLS